MPAPPLVKLRSSAPVWGQHPRPTVSSDPAANLNKQGSAVIGFDDWQENFRSLLATELNYHCQMLRKEVRHDVHEELVDCFGAENREASVPRLLGVQAVDVDAEMWKPGQKKKQLLRGFSSLSDEDTTDSFSSPRTLKHSQTEAEQDDDSNWIKRVTSQRHSARMEEKAKPGIAAYVMGFAAEMTEKEKHRHIWSGTEGENDICLRRMAVKLVRSHYFEIFVLSMIVANALLVGVQTQVMALQGLNEVPAVYRGLDISYLLVCAFEVALRLYVHRSNFFTMWGCAWNIFDLLLVFAQVLEEVLLLAASNDSSIRSSMSIFSIVRLLRALRVVRILRVLQHARSLRLLVGCILYCVRPLFWSGVLIGAMTYINSIYFTQIITTQRLEMASANVDPQEIAELEQLYGSVTKSALSMFQAISGGLDWDTIVQPLLRQEMYWPGLLLVSYVGFALLAVMNVVTGLFVQNAMERAAEVRQMSLVGHIRGLFETLDRDESGRISFEELKQHLDQPAVKACFKAIDIHVSEASLLFEMLDADGSGEIDFREFVEGCMRLQGPARAVDLLLASRDSQQSLEKQWLCMRSLAGLERPLGNKFRDAVSTSRQRNQKSPLEATV
eukprot:TRINITY_DN24959_c0_g1_i1.p1 TRINITY_DN24959_c0_g1~~TRINITY_DN24959_c0_g1_i1.p1  ORF type:complete len:613 (-),score=119.46 TRINITY_DN24959_c0_g1_i1:80-1918(-)